MNELMPGNARRFAAIPSGVGDGRLPLRMQAGGSAEHGRRVQAWGRVLRDPGAWRRATALGALLGATLLLTQQSEWWLAGTMGLLGAMVVQLAMGASQVPRETRGPRSAWRWWGDEGSAN